MIPKRTSANARRAVLATQAQIERDLARLKTDGEKLKYLDLVGDLIHSELLRAGVEYELNRGDSAEAGKD